MRNIFTLLLLFFFTLGCNKGNPIRNDFNYKNEKISELINSYKNEQNINKREIILQNTLSLLKENKNTKLTRDNLAFISFELYNFPNNKNFFEASNLLLKLSLQSQDTQNLGKAYRCKGIYFKNTQRLDSSYIYYIKAEKIYKKANDEASLGNVLFNKGLVQSIIGDYLGAELSLTRAYNIYKNTNENQKLYGTLNQLGLVYTELKEYDKAVFFHNKALETVIKNNVNDSHQREICYNNLGYLFLRQEKFDLAIKNFELGLEDKNIFKDDPDLYALLIDNLAYAKFKTSNFNQIPQLFYKALNIRKKLKDDTVIIASYLHLSEYYFKINNVNESIVYSQKALSKAKESKIPSNIILSLKQAALVDKENTQKYSNLYIRINDSLQLSERKNIDRFARIELETDELRQEKSVLEERNRNILSYLLGTIIIGGFLFFIRIQRSRQRELALKQSQQQANEEIYRLIISHQNQLEEGRDLEKKRISKELHDGVLGRLFGLRLNLEGLNNFDDHDAKQTRQEYLNELKVIEQDLREISHELNRENLVLINNFEAIINNHLDQQAKNYKPKLTSHLSDTINWEILPNTTKINLYRILQEALQNINKHAEAKNINVKFIKDAKGNLVFTIEDDGKGYNTNSKRSMGIGLSNIVERVHQCDGKIDIRSQLGKGTKIMITFPLENDTINM